MNEEPTRNWGGAVLSLIFLGVAGWFLVITISSPAHFWWMGLLAVPLLQIGGVGLVQSVTKHLRDEKGRILR